MAGSGDRLVRQLLADGIVRRLVPGIQLTDEPKLSDWNCEASLPGQSQCRATGGGYGLHDGIARIKAVGEALERLCCATIPAHALRRARHRDLAAAVDPARFVNFSQHALGGGREEYVARVRDASVNWVAATCAASGERAWLPAQLVYAPYDASAEPLIRVPITTGAAFETSREMAIQRGLFEIVERDSFMLWWLSGKTPPKLKPAGSRLAGLIRYFDRYLLDVDLLDITTDVAVTTVLAVIRDRTDVGPAVSCGLKSAHGLVEASIGALVEAYQSRKYIRCFYLREACSGAPTADEVIDAESRGLFWYPGEMREAIGGFLSGRALAGRRRPRIGNLQHHLLQRGFDVYHVELSPEPMQHLGCHVLRTVVPQMHPLFLGEDHRYDYSERLARFHDGPLNRLPHPCL